MEKLPLIKLNGVKKQFKAHGEIVRAVDGVDLSLFAGQNLSLVGESGCGKTTMARMIIKLLSPTEGTIYFEGKDISLMKSAETKEMRRNVQMVFQDPYSSLDPRFTVRNIMKEGFTLEHEKVQKKTKTRKNIFRIF